ncbi:MAG: M48 family metalloprotease [Pseudomonadota bacterium]|nr:M48 family metalloprotease [Pseudomonadota bacterium]
MDISTVGFRLLLCMVVAVAGILSATALPANAQRISFIRDAETENTIRAYVTPLLLAARLEPSAVRIFIVKDKALNAFVAAGQNLFINTGLIMRTADASEVMGVLAHETGHIAGGHLIRSTRALKDASASTILGYVLGGAAIVAGRPDVGSAIISGSQSLAVRSYLKFSRTQESAADRAGLRFLDETRQSSAGMLNFMKTLGEQELLSAPRQDAYVRTHPLTRDRIHFLEHHVANSRYTNVPTPEKFKRAPARMVAKLRAFTQTKSRTFKYYPKSDISVPARYARAIALFRNAKTNKALKIMAGLIFEQPDDPYFHELKGQILFENGRIDEAIPPYEKAAELLPGSSLILADLARAQMQKDDATSRDKAIRNLNSSLAIEPKRPFTWRLLATAEGKNSNMVESWRALAEEALLHGRFDNAISLARRSQSRTEVGTPVWLRTEDIIAAATEAKNNR